LCGRPDKFDFNVPDWIWEAAVPPPVVSGVICLFCFDGLAEMRGVDYAPHLGPLHFAGEKAVFVFDPSTALSV
jgi:hypothetical protein